MKGMVSVTWQMLAQGDFILGKGGSCKDNTPKRSACSLPEPHSEEAGNTVSPDRWVGRSCVNVIETLHQTEPGEAGVELML